MAASGVPVSTIRRVLNHAEGSVTQIYMTTDGGAHLDTLYSLYEQLPDHVQIVNHNELVRMAMASLRNSHE